MEKKRIEKAGNTTYEYRYFISSLKTDINEASRAVRGHWSVESMHWQLDVTFKEDANTTLDKQAAENLNIIRKWCLSILKMVEIFRPNLSMKKETICNQYEPSRVFGTGIKFLKTRYFRKEEGNNSCVCRARRSNSLASTQTGIFLSQK